MFLFDLLLFVFMKLIDYCHKLNARDQCSEQMHKKLIVKFVNSKHTKMINLFLMQKKWFMYCNWRNEECSKNVVFHVNFNEISTHQFPLIYLHFYILWCASEFGFEIISFFLFFLLLYLTLIYLSMFIKSTHWSKRK